MRFHSSVFNVNNVIRNNTIEVIVIPYPHGHLLIIDNIPAIIPRVNIRNNDCLIDIYFYFFQM